MIKVGIIGGSGLDDPKILKNAGEIMVEYPLRAADIRLDLRDH